MKEIETLCLELADLRKINNVIEDDQISLLQQMTDNNAAIDDCNQQVQEITNDLKKRDAHSKVIKNDLNQLHVQIKSTKSVQLQQMGNLDNLRQNHNEADSKNGRIQKQISHIMADIAIAKEKVITLNGVLEARDADIQTTVEATKQAQTMIKNGKYELKQLDDEICYFEDQNRKNSAAQSQLQKAYEYELGRSKEL